MKLYGRFCRPTAAGAGRLPSDDVDVLASRCRADRQRHLVAGLLVAEQLSDLLRLLDLLLVDGQEHVVGLEAGLGGGAVRRTTGDAQPALDLLALEAQVHRPASSPASGRAPA